MKKYRYRIAIFGGDGTETRDGYLKTIIASCGTSVSLFLTKIHGKWHVDHAATGYSFGKISAPTRAALIAFLDKRSTELADKTLSVSGGAEIINPEFSKETPND